MAKLEARVHPPVQRNENSYIVVGYVRPVVEPSSSLALVPAPATQYWSFVHVQPSGLTTSRG